MASSASEMEAACVTPARMSVIKRAKHHLPQQAVVGRFILAPWAYWLWVRHAVALQHAGVQVWLPARIADCNTLDCRYT